MKILFIGFLLLASCTFAKAQLSGTKWSGTMMIPTPTNVALDFKKDTVNLVFNDTQDIAEVMTYTVKDNIITFKKVDGHSPCEVGAVATIKYLITNDTLSLTVINDDCDGRRNAWPADPMKKIK